MGGVWSFAGAHRTAGGKDRRDVEPHCAHEHAGNHFIAVRDADHGVERMCGTHGFDAVGDDFTAGEGVLHAGVSHRDTVTDGDGVEFIGNAAGFPDGVADDFSDFFQVAVTGYNVGVGVADADIGFGNIGMSDAGCSHQSAVRRTLQSFLHDVTSHGNPLFFTKNY